MSSSLSVFFACEGRFEKSMSPALLLLPPNNIIKCPSIPSRFCYEVANKMEDKQDGNADSSHVEDQTKSPREIPPWAQGTNLRNVEKDVLIPKIMREKAKIKCKDLVDGRLLRDDLSQELCQIMWHVLSALF